MKKNRIYLGSVMGIFIGASVWLLQNPREENVLPIENVNVAQAEEKRLQESPLEEKEQTQESFSELEDATPTTKEQSFEETPIREDFTKSQYAIEELRDFFRLQRKALLSEEERGKLKADLSNPRLHRRAAEEILKVSASDGQDEFFKRMTAVEFLGEGLRWADNPERESVIENAKAVALTALPQGLPTDQAQVAVGDRMELLWQLMVHAPEEQTRLLVEARTASQKRLVRKSMDLLLARMKEREEWDQYFLEN